MPSSFTANGGGSPSGLSQDSALHRAAVDGDVFHIEALLASHSLAGLTVDEAGSGGRTPLMSAARAGQVAAVRKLLSRGASPLATDQDGWSVLHHAAWGGSEAAVEEVLRALELSGTPLSEAVDAQDARGRSALHVCASEGHGGTLPLIELLLEAGASVELQDEGGNTPLTLAEAEGNSMVLEHLRRLTVASLQQALEQTRAEARELAAKHESAARSVQQLQQAYARAQGQLADAEAAVSHLRSDLAAVRSQLKVADEGSAALAGLLGATEERLAQAEARRAALQGRLAEVEGSLARAEAGRAALHARLSEAEGSLAQAWALETGQQARIGELENMLAQARASEAALQTRLKSERRWRKFWKEAAIVVPSLMALVLVSWLGPANKPAPHLGPPLPPRWVSNSLQWTCNNLHNEVSPMHATTGNPMPPCRTEGHCEKP